MNRICIHRGKLCVHVHVSAVVMAAYMALTGYADLMCTAYASIILHEGAHAAVSAMLGHMPDEIELTPLGAMLYLHDQARIPPIRRAIILLAGPAATFLLCIVAPALTRIGWLTPDSGRMLFTCNLGILLINLLPCLPMDGGSLLSLMLSGFLPMKTCCTIMRIAGNIVGLCLIVMAFLAAWHDLGFNLSLVIIGCFLMYAAQTATAKSAMNELRKLMDRKALFERRRIIASSAIAVMDDVPVMQLMRLLPYNRHMTYIILERGTMRQTGIIGEEKVIAAALDMPALTAGELLGEPGKNNVS